jgi:NADH-quinone oxidoreductase subunit C
VRLSIVMYPVDFFPKLSEKFPGVVPIPPKEKFVRDPEPQLEVPAASLVEVCRALKEDPELAFDMPIQMTAVDYIKDEIFELVYYLYSTRKKRGVVLKTRIPRSAAVVDSVAGIWCGMDWQEREVFDLMGIRFNHHPNLKRIMMWDGFPGYPLRKDYVHVTDKYDSGVEVGTPGLDEKGLPVQNK